MSGMADRMLNEYEKNKDFILNDLHLNICLPADDIIEEFDLEEEDVF